MFTIGTFSKLAKTNIRTLRFYDEIGFIKFLETIYTAAAPAQSQASLEAERNHKPHFKAMELHVA